MPQRIYFDNAATTAPDPRVLDAMRPCLDQFWGNPSSLYVEGRQAREAVDRARDQVAEALGAAPTKLFSPAAAPRPTIWHCRARCWRPVFPAPI